MHRDTATLSSARISAGRGSKRGPKLRKLEYSVVKCRLIWNFRGQALLLRVLHVVACDSVRDCVFLKEDVNHVKKGLNLYELNFSLPTSLIHKIC